MSKKKKRIKSYEFDPEIGRAIEKQAQKQQEIENKRKRKKRTLIFWGGAIFGVVVIAAISVIFLLALGLMEW